MVCNAEQELSTIKKLSVMEEAKKKLDAMFVERRISIVPVDLERRRA